MTPDYSNARDNMVEGQVRTADVTQPDLIEAFREVPRERFVSTAQKSLAYLDSHLPVAKDRWLLAPAHLARLIQAATIDRDDVVLVVGCASGYASAIISKLCQSVVAVEPDAELAQAASQTLTELECDNVAVLEKPLAEGCPREAPFDAIVVCGAIDTLPDALCDQLREGGRLIAVQGHGNSGMATIWVKDDGAISARPVFNCALPPLPGFEAAKGFVF